MYVEKSCIAKISSLKHNTLDDWSNGTHKPKRELANSLRALDLGLLRKMGSSDKCT